MCMYSMFVGCVQCFPCHSQAVQFLIHAHFPVVRSFPSNSCFHLRPCFLMGLG